LIVVTNRGTLATARKRYDVVWSGIGKWIRSSVLYRGICFCADLSIEGQ
jgi:hypothetical protein